MNSGIIASRYGKALLRYVLHTGNGEEVYDQTCVLVLRMKEIPQLREYLENHSEIEKDKKIQLVETALGRSLPAELENFISLVIERSRTVFLLRMLLSFISQYRKALNIKVGKIITALPARGLKERLEAYVGERTGAQVHLKEIVDPEISGGFVFELGDLRLDASVTSQFVKIRRSLVENNERKF